MKVPPASHPFGNPADVIREHIRLVRVLSKGSKQEQKKEAKKQSKELRELLKKHGKN